MKINHIILTILILIFCKGTNAQLKLIPVPQVVELKNSFFQFRENTAVVGNDLNTFYVDELTNCIKKELNVNLSMSRRSERNYIEFLRAVTAKQLMQIIKNEDLDSNFNPGDEGYILKITPNSIKVISYGEAGIFYGIQTLKQLIAANTIDNSIPCLIIYDYPDFSIRAWQDDISRGPIPTMELLKEQIRKMASFKLNYLTLYTEHVFKLQNHPGIAPDDGITKEQIRELSDFAKKYHVTLIGNYQSFGHMGKTLSNPAYKHLAENNHIISPALQESYEFLRDVYQEIVPVYDGQYFNINCDETFGLGEGKSKSMVDSIGIEGVYLSHINRLNTLLKPYNKSILMWGDIAGNHPKIVNHLPENITVMAWGYHAAESFDYAITPISSTGLDFWVAPGINCWSNIYPNLQEAEVNIFNFIRDGRKYNASGVLNTSWDDDGLNFFQNNWHGFAWGAENSWNAPATNITLNESGEEREKLYHNFNKAFDAIFYGLKDETLTTQIVKFSEMHKSGVRDVLRNGRFFEPLFPIHLDYVQNGKKEENKTLLRKTDTLMFYFKSLIPKVKHNGIAIDYLQFAIREVQFTLQKNLLRIDLYQFLEGDTSISKTDLKNSINTLIKEAKSLQFQYVELWNKENRNWWLAENMKKFDKLIKSLEDLEGYCIINTHNNLTEKGRKITLHSIFDDLPIYYALGNDTIKQLNEKYTEPLYIREDVKVLAGVINNNKVYPVSVDSLIYHKGIGKLYKLNSSYSKYHPSYDGGGSMALLDGKLGSPKDLRNGRWQGFSGQNIELEIDLGKTEAIHTFSMGFYQNTFSWVIFPKEVKIYFKNSIEEEYKLIKTITHTISPKEKGALKHNFETAFQEFNTRYLKVVATYYGKLPEWHHAGSQYESMIFADEIILK